MSNAETLPVNPLPQDAAPRWKRVGTILVRFFSLQLVTQALLAVTGIVLVRALSKPEYAYFTIANTMQGTMNVLADSGISIGVMSIGGKVWQDKYRFGQLINSALLLRKRLAIAVIIAVSPILLWTLHSNGASAFYCFLILGVVLTSLNAQLTTGVLEVVPRLRAEFMRFTKLDMTLAVARLALIAAAYILLLDAVVAVAMGSVTLLIKSYVLKQWAAEGVERNAPARADDRTEIVKIVKRQAPLSLFFCLQGQITIWLLSVFGNVRSIAEIGALGGLTVVFALVNTTLGNIVIPRFAKIQERDALISFYWRVLAMALLFFGFLLALAYWAPNQILWILGKQYKHLQQALLLMMLSSVIYNFSAIIWSMNAARAWVEISWLNIPLTIGTEICLLLLIKVNTTQGAILFSLFSFIPGLLLNICMSYIGFRKMACIHL